MVKTGAGLQSLISISNCRLFYVYFMFHEIFHESAVENADADTLAKEEGIKEEAEEKLEELVEKVEEEEEEDESKEEKEKKMLEVRKLQGREEQQNVRAKKWEEKRNKKMLEVRKPVMQRRT